MNFASPLVIAMVIHAAVGAGEPAPEAWVRPRRSAVPKPEPAVHNGWVPVAPNSEQDLAVDGWQPTRPEKLPEQLRDPSYDAVRRRARRQQQSKADSSGWSSRQYEDELFELKPPAMAKTTPPAISNSTIQQASWTTPVVSEKPTTPTPPNAPKQIRIEPNAGQLILSDPTEGRRVDWQSDWFVDEDEPARVPPAPAVPVEVREPTSRDWQSHPPPRRRVEPSVKPATPPVVVPASQWNTDWQSEEEAQPARKVVPAAAIDETIEPRISEKPAALQPPAETKAESRGGVRILSPISRRLKQRSAFEPPDFHVESPPAVISRPVAADGWTEIPVPQEKRPASGPMENEPFESHAPIASVPRENPFLKREVASEVRRIIPVARSTVIQKASANETAVPAEPQPTAEAPKKEWVAEIKTANARPAESNPPLAPHSPSLHSLDSLPAPTCWSNYDGTPPQWRFATRSLFLDRSNGNSRPLAINAAGATLASTSNLDFPWKYGQEATLAWQFDSANAWETSGFWVADATSRLNLNGPGSITIPFSGTGSAAFAGLNNLTANLRSSLWNIETNWVHTFCDWADGRRVNVLAGARFLGADERLNFQTSSATATGSYSNAALNSLYGGQIGVQGSWEQLFLGFGVDSGLKIGFMGNGGRVRQNLTSSTGGTLQSSSAAFDRFTPLLDAGFDLTYTFRPGVRASAGYRLLYLSSVARGTDQWTTNLAVANPGNNPDGSFFVHGLMAGLQVQWGHPSDPCVPCGCCLPHCSSDCSRGFSLFSR